LKKITQIISFVLIGFALNISNPSKNEFIDFISIEIKKKYPEINLQANADSSAVEQILVGFGNTVITNILKESTTQKDYWLFSVYELDMRLLRDFGAQVKNVKVIGIANTFIPLSSFD
jgi:hypothetical protein